MGIGDQAMLENYKKHVEERAKENIPPLPLDAEQTSELINLLKSEHDESEFLLFLQAYKRLQNNINLTFSANCHNLS